MTMPTMEPMEPMPSMMMMMMMPMHFGFGVENTFLFDKFTTTTGLQYGLALGSLFLVSIAVEVLSYIRSQMHNAEVRNELVKKMSMQLQS
jgi:hypothetical protein